MVRALIIGVLVAVAAFGCGGGQRASTGGPAQAQAPPLAASEEALDSVMLMDGQQIYGRVIHEGPDSVVIGQPNGTFTLKRSEVASVQKHAGHRGMRRGLAHSQRLAPFDAMIEIAARQPWVGKLQQVPATVIGIGELRDIPYISHRAENIEFNVYGDHEHPAAIEVGIYAATPDEATRSRLRAFIAELLPSPADRVAVENLNLVDDESEREGLTFDVDPPTGADSFGAWWISIYDLAALDSARASADELTRLTTPATSSDSTASTGWSASDHSYTSPRSSSSNSSSSSGGRVYVRGYTRKNGTYVQPHTRSTPRSHRR